ncbi:hypothetical protein [Vineibacter terrae]|nr:hypothetical protein [Vineibacter terrae]
MMFFQDAQFPRCASVIRLRIVGGKLSERVRSALLECIESDALGTKALSAGTYPRVNIVKLVSNGVWDRRVGGLYSGDCDPADLNKVFVNWNVAQDLERYNAPYNARNFERTLLHEVVHWGRKIAGKSGTIGGIEAGDVFEFKAGYTKFQGDHDDRACP